MANKIILVTGPHEGVGKTTLAANLAARYAQLRHQPVILIDSDPLCRGEVAMISGTTPSLSVMGVLEQLAGRTALPMLRGQVATNRFGIGSISLVSDQRDIERLKPEQWSFFLETFSQIYDLVVDMEISHPMKNAALDAADMVVWTFLPNALSVKATAQQLDVLQSQKYGFHKFVFALNQMGAAGALPLRMIEQSLERFQKAFSLQLPIDPELNRLLNAGEPALLEHGGAYADSVLHLLEQLPRFQRGPRTGSAALSGRGQTPSTWVSTVSRAGGTVSAIQNQVVDGLVEEKRKHWNSVKQQLHRDLVDELNIRRIDLDTKGDPARERQLRTNVENTVNGLIGKEKDLPLTRDERERLVKELVDEALGLGPLEELLADPSITEIMVNRFDQVYIERAGKILLTHKRFVDNNHVIQVIRRIISPLGRRIDESIPMVDARLKDGSRVNAIIPPLAVQGPSITIRRFPERALSADDLVRTQSITKSMVDFLKVCVQIRKNMVISGGTGTGKTTILNMLSSFIPNDDRIVTVEDTAELRMQQEHVVRLEARPANIEGQGQVSIRDLVKNCLRMRPDRIVVGECRGGEALDMLQAMNTGHDGSLTTIHANTPRDCFTRLETLCLMAGMDLPVWALREQIRSAVQLVIQLARLSDGSRRVVCITEVIGRDEENILTQDLFHFVQDSLDEQGRVHGHYEADGNLPKFFPELKARGLGLDASMFQKPSKNDLQLGGAA